MARRIQRLQPAIRSPDEGVVKLPFTYQMVDGVPVIVNGDTLANVANTAAGKHTLTFRDKPPVVFEAHASVSMVGDSTDMYAQCDWSDVVANGVLVVKLKTAGTNTNPPANAFIGGYILAKTTTRRARGLR